MLLVAYRTCILCATDEPLERDLETMVRHKVRSAYRNIMAPCIVEHAGLVLERFDSLSYPGGLTQPMWDALGAEGFVDSIRWAGTRAIARAVVGYCNGLRIRTFVGETRGTVVSKPRGSRAFYWDPAAPMTAVTSPMLKFRIGTADCAAKWPYLNQQRL
jgi:XTP/dITP diphosphohydrolase